MRLWKSTLLGTICLAGTGFAAQAQYLYPGPQYYQAPATAPAWSYNPYTSGFGPCPQRLPNDSTSCREQMPPTFGQPDFRTRAQGAW